MGKRQREAERQRAIHELEYLLFTRRVRERECVMCQAELQRYKDELEQLLSNPNAGSTEIIFAKIALNKCAGTIKQAENGLNNLNAKIEKARARCEELGVNINDREM